MGVYISDEDSKFMDDLCERRAAFGASIAFHTVVDVVNQMSAIWKRSKAANNLRPSIIPSTYKATIPPADIESLSDFKATIDVPVSIERSLQAAFGLTQDQVDKGVRAKVVYFNVADESTEFKTAEEAVKRGEFMGLANEIHNETDLDMYDAVSLAEKLDRAFKFTRK